MLMRLLRVLALTRRKSTSSGEGALPPEAVDMHRGVMVFSRLARFVADWGFCRRRATTTSIGGGGV